MCSRFFYQFLQDLRILQHRAGTEHILIKRLIVMVGHEQRLFQDLKDGVLPDIAVGIVNEYTGSSSPLALMWK